METASPLLLSVEKPRVALSELCSFFMHGSYSNQFKPDEMWWPPYVHNTESRTY